MRKLSVFSSLVLAIVMAVALAVPVAAEQFATVDVARVTSTGEGEPDNGFTPEVIFDGDEFTRWGSMQAGESVTAAFAQEYFIEAVEIRFFRAGVREHLFTMEYSADGSNWAEIASTKPHSTADPDLEIFGEEEGYWELFPLVNAVSARYFRWTYEGRMDGATVGSIWDMRFVVGEAPAEPEPEPEEPEEAAPAAADDDAPPPEEAEAAKPAPQTADPIALAALGSLIAIVGAVAAKKRK